MESFQISDTGIVRELNEDSFGSFLSKDGLVRFFIVADGMGGHLAGEVASKMAVDLLEKAALSYEYTGEESLRKFFTVCINSIDSEICDMAQKSENCSDMGTTAVIYAAAEDYGLFCNVGDSRGYVLSDGILTQITKDHSLVQSMIDGGYIFDSESGKNPFSHAITKALGFLSKIDGDASCDIFKVTPKAGDTVLLCSDGLTSTVPGEIIAERIIENSDIKTTAEVLVSEANNRGGHDNITVSIIRYGR